MNIRSAAARCCDLVAPVVVVLIVGCGPNPLDQIPTPPVQFKSPTGTFAVRDDQTLPIQYTVTVDHAITARLELDRDEIAGNGNETRLSPEQTFDAPGGDGRFDFVAGEFPYGTYHLRVVLTDESGSVAYPSGGPLQVVPLVENGSDDNHEGVAMLPDVEGLRLVQASGDAGKVSSRVPFVSTWSTPDVKDQLSPVYISPVQIEKPITVHRMQFYTYSKHPEEKPKTLQIYSGTNEGSPGSLMQQINVRMPSSSNGGWNMVTIDPPLTLQPGRYGVSFHGEEECSENWAANASGGQGFVLMSRLQGKPFVPVTQNDLGFSPNFTMRMLGTISKDGTGLSLADDISADPPVAVDPPDSPPPVDTFPSDGGKPSKTDCDEGEDELGGSTPFHVAWQVIK